MYGDSVLKAEADSFVTWPLSAAASIKVGFSIGFAYKPLSSCSNMPKTLSGRQSFGRSTPTSSPNDL